MANAVLFLVGLVFLIEMVDASLFDFKEFQIPNRIPVLLILAFPVMAVSSGMDLGHMLTHLAAGTALFLMGAILFFLRIWGGGDAKLLPAVALWVGLAALPRFLLVMALVGGGLALAALAARHVPSVKGVAGARWVRAASTGQVPYGIAIAAAGVDWWAQSMLPRIVGGLS